MIGRSINSRTLNKLYSKTDLPFKITSGEEAIIALRYTFNQYNLLKSQAITHRQTFLEELATAVADANNGKKETILKQLMLHESQRAVSRKLKYTLGKMRQGVSAVEVMNANGEWEVTTKKGEVEQECMRENIRRFTQANNSPSLRDDQVQILGWMGDTNEAVSILEGGPLPHNLDPLLARLTPYLKRPNNTSNEYTIPTDILKADYEHAWKRCREFTSTGTSGLHFGHFQASINDITLLELDRRLLEISFQTGHIMKRWKQGIDVMIPKKIGSLRASQLRTIVLMEPDFNLINKNQSIAAEQFGSRKAKSAITHAIINN